MLSQLPIIETERLFSKKFTPNDFITLFEKFDKKAITPFVGFTTDDEFQKEKSKYEQG